MYRKQASLEPVNKKIVAANREPLMIYGRTRIIMNIGGRSYLTTFIVADLNLDGVTGLDFILDNACVLEVEQQTLIIRKESTALVKNGHFGCFRVAVSETINIPPKAEPITKCNV